MSSQMPKPPIQSAIADKDGRLSFAWIAFFTQLFQRVGEGSAETNLELAGSTGTAQSSITSITNQISSINAKISSLQGIGVGRQL